MAQLINAIAIAQSAFQGVRTIYQFTNWDGELVPFNCGQAAACTYLTYTGKLTPVEEQAGEIMRRIEKTHPPDNLGGYMGTSRRRVERICRSHGVILRPVLGETKLREQLTLGNPVIVMLSVPGQKLFNRFTMPAGHWMVAYGFDEQDVHLTNWGKMSWVDFRRRWNTLVPRIIGMSNLGLVSRSPSREAATRSGASA